MSTQHKAKPIQIPRRMQLHAAITRLDASPFARRLLATTFWSAMGESLSKGLMLLSMVIVARILGKEGYGEFGMVRTTINMFATLGGVGLGFTANRYVARFRDTDKRYSGQIVGSSYVLAAGFGACVGLCVFAGARFLSIGVLAAPQLEGGLKVAGFLLFLGAINGAQLGILQGLEAYRRLAVGAFAQGALGLLSFSVGSYYAGLNGALAGFLLYTLGGVLLFHGLIRRELRQQQIEPSYRQLKRVLPIFWSFSVPAALMGIAVAPFKWFAETELARSSNFKELGVFYAAMTVASMFLALVGTLNSPLISLTANLQDSKPSARIQYLNLYGSWYLFLVLAIPCLLFPHLPALIFGEGYGGPEFRAVNLLLFVYCGLLVYYQGIMRFVALHGSLWFGLFTNLCEGIALIVVFYYFAGSGVVGLGYAYIASYLVRILVTTPFLIDKKIVPTALLFDKYFVLTLTVLLAVVAFQLSRIP